LGKTHYFQEGEHFYKYFYFFFEVSKALSGVTEMHGYNHVEEDNVKNVDNVPSIFDVFPSLLLQLNQFNQEVGY
jgi:hypothetical protein